VCPRITHISGADGNLLQETNIVSAQLLGERGTAMTKFSTLCVVGAALLMVGCVSQQEHEATQQKYEASQQRNAELEAQYKQLNETMGSEIAAHELHISRMQDAIKVSLNDDLLFPSGGSEMSADAKTSVAKVAAILAPHQKNKINVNGYTDSTPIGPELQKQGITTNLILSQKRADAVMQFMISQGVKSNLVSAQGFGEANPVASNDTPEGRAQNRRVELTIASPGN
jgi:chemotaxis protein MotB